MENNPDVVLIQETKQTDAKFPFVPLEQLGYQSAHYGQGQWNGVAIFSKVGLDDVTRGFGDEDPEARIIGATCGGVRVYSCYVPNGRALDDPHYAYKLQWLAKLADLVSHRDTSQPFAAGGDFNVAPTDLDCYDPSAFLGATHVSEPERAALRALEGAGSVSYTHLDVYKRQALSLARGEDRGDTGLVPESSRGRVAARRTREHGRVAVCSPADALPVA